MCVLNIPVWVVVLFACECRPPEFKGYDYYLNRMPLSQVDRAGRLISAATFRRSQASESPELSSGLGRTTRSIHRRKKEKASAPHYNQPIMLYFMKRKRCFYYRGPLPTSIPHVVPPNPFSYL